MFTTGASYGKLKTNLRLAVNRLKLLEKKKTELAQKARREIADYLATGKLERARIRVEHIVREDYLVEAMEMIEMYCDLLLARFGIIQQMKTLDDGLAESISSLIWAAPRLQTDVTELKVIAEQLTQKYGKQYALACRDNSLATVNEKLVHKLGVQAPPRILVERYLIEIARSHNVPYEPDESVMNQQEDAVVEAEAMLIDLGAGSGRPGDGSSGGGASGGGGGGQIGFVVGPQPIMQPQPPFSYPSKPPSSSSSSFPASPLDTSGKPPPLPQAPPSAPFPSLSKEQQAYTPYQPSADTQPNYDDSPLPPYDEVMRNPQRHTPTGSYPSPAAANDPPRPTPMPRNVGVDTLPELPAVPTGSLSHNGSAGGGGEASGDDVDFDDLAKRFEALKKKK